MTGGTQTKNQLLSKIQFSNQMRAPFPHACTRSGNLRELGRTLPTLIPRAAAAHHCSCGEPPGNGVNAMGRASFPTAPPQRVELTTTGCWRPKVKYGNNTTGQPHGRLEYYEGQSSASSTQLLTQEVPTRRTALYLHCFLPKYSSPHGIHSIIA